MLHRAKYFARLFFSAELVDLQHYLWLLEVFITQLMTRHINDNEEMSRRHLPWRVALEWTVEDNE